MSESIHAGMMLGETAAQVATSGECELTKFAMSCYMRFVVHPRALHCYSSTKDFQLPVEARGGSMGATGGERPSRRVRKSAFQVHTLL